MPPFTKEQQLGNKKKRFKEKTTTKGKVTQEVYDEVSHRDKGRCVICGSSFWIELHHAIPKSRGGNGKPYNLVSLCKHCHYDKIHGKGDVEAKKAMLEFLIEEYNRDDTKRELEYILYQEGNKK